MSSLSEMPNTDALEPALRWAVWEEFALRDKAWDAHQQLNEAWGAHAQFWLESHEAVARYDAAVLETMIQSARSFAPTREDERD